MRKLLTALTLSSLGAFGFSQSPYGWHENFWHYFPAVRTTLAYTSYTTLSWYDQTIERNGAIQPPSWKAEVASLIPAGGTIIVTGSPNTPIYVERATREGNNVIAQGWRYLSAPSDPIQQILYPERERSHRFYKFVGFAEEM